MAQQPQAEWYVVHCIDCAATLKSHGPPPEKPICLKCTLIRAAPEADRLVLKATLFWPVG